MSIKLLINEDSQDKRLVRLLKEAGHDVVTASEAGLMGKPDSEVFQYAMARNHVILTQNCQDF